MNSALAKANDLADAARRLRDARSKYREAIRAGDLRAAVKAREAQITAEVIRNIARTAIEGDPDE